MKINDRKLDHLRICAENQVEKGDTGFESIQLVHKALPELDFDKIDTSTKFLGKKLAYPIIIEAMTGGVAEAGRINKEIASVAQELGIGFGVGSQRAAIEDATLEDTFKVRDVAPDILLIANLGAVQLNYGYGISECKRAIDMIKADALALHLNALQEVVQPEGDRNFAGLTNKINDIASRLNKPVIIKETGCGISYNVAKQLKNISAIDVSGAGGTSWSLVESYRRGGLTKEIGQSFAEWGIPTTDAIIDSAKLKKPIIASGGIRTGIEAAKAIAIGGDCVGLALPVLKAYQKGGKSEVKNCLDKFIYELKTAMFLTGCGTIKQLKGK
jgi:isopentenyl-diphosphate Delta-isomerase